MGLGAGVEPVVGVCFLGLGADLIMCLSEDGVVNMFSSCCLDIFSYPSTFLNLATIINSCVIKFSKSAALYTMPDNSSNQINLFFWLSFQKVINNRLDKNKDICAIKKN